MSLRHSNEISTFEFGKKILPAVIVAMIAAVLALTGCTQSTSSNTADNSANTESNQAATSEEQGSEQMNVIVEVLDPDNAEQSSNMVSVMVPADSTVFDAVNLADVGAVIEDSEYGKYITAFGDKAAEGNAGWVYTVNGEEVMESIDSYVLSDGDTVQFSYVSM